jgi:hypothetical protein
MLANLLCRVPWLHLSAWSTQYSLLKYARLSSIVCCIQGTNGEILEQGRDNIKSTWPLWAGHTCHKWANDNERQCYNAKRILKITSVEITRNKQDNHCRNTGCRSKLGVDHHCRALAWCSQICGFILVLDLQNTMGSNTLLGWATLWCTHEGLPDTLSVYKYKML